MKKLIDAQCESNIYAVDEEHVLSENVHFVVDDKVGITISST